MQYPQHLQRSELHQRLSNLGYSICSSILFLHAQDFFRLSAYVYNLLKIHPKLSLPSSVYQHSYYPKYPHHTKPHKTAIPLPPLKPTTPLITIQPSIHTRDHLPHPPAKHPQPPIPTPSNHHHHSQESKKHRSIFPLLHLTLNPSCP